MTVPPATIRYVLAGKADVAAGDRYRTQLRAEVLDISAPTDLDKMGICSEDPVDTVQGPVGEKVGTVPGFDWVLELQTQLGANLRLCPNPVALAHDLAAGRVDVGVDSCAIGVYAQKKGGNAGIEILVSKPATRVRTTVEPAQSGLLDTRGNAALGAALDDRANELHAGGTIAALVEDAGLDPSGADVGAPPHDAVTARGAYPPGPPRR